MPVPGYEIIKYPLSAQFVEYDGGYYANIVGWQFPSVPQGQTWTFSLLPAAPNYGSDGGYPGTIWTLLRNGQQEMTWLGNTVVADLQAVAGDVISVVAYNVPVQNFFNPSGYSSATQNQLTMQGFSVPSQNAIPVLPRLCPSGDAFPTLSFDPFTVGYVKNVSGLADGSVQIPGLSAADLTGASILGVQLAYAVGTASGKTLIGSCAVNTDGADTVDASSLAGLAVACGGGNSASQAVYVPINNLLYPTNGLYLGWNGFSNSAAGVITVVVYFNAY